MALNTLNSYKADKIALVISGIFKQQSAAHVFQPNADLDMIQPQTTPVLNSLTVTREQQLDCKAKFVVLEKVTSKVNRYQLTFDATAQLLFGWLAYLDGIAAAPTGTPANETQVIKSVAVAGTHLFDLDHEGYAGGGAVIPFNATPAQAKAALEKLDAIGKDNVIVTGTALNDVAGLTVEFVERLEKANMPLMTVSGTAGATVTAGTNGTNKIHLGGRTTGDNPVLFSVMHGIEGVTTSKKYGDMAAESFNVRATRRGKLVITIICVGSANYEEIEDFVFPECSNEPPLMVEDCRAAIGSFFFVESFRELSLTKTNEIDLTEDAFAYKGIHISTLENGTPTAAATLQVLGNEFDELGIFLEDENNAFDALTFYFGKPGERVTYVAPNTQFRFDDTPTALVGRNRKTALNIVANPRPDNSGNIDSFTYNGAQTAQFLQSSV